MKILVRTPAPHDTESLRGYVLRVSEANGYDSPLHIMRHAGFTRSEQMSQRLPLDKLEPLLGLSGERLEHLSNSGRGIGVPHPEILGHASKFWYRHRFLRGVDSAFCPQCVAQQGFLDAFWDINLVVACPDHRCALLTGCSVCGKALTWVRPGILTCKCGARLASCRAPRVDPAVLDLMHVLRNKLHRRPLAESANGSGFPIKEIEAISLWGLFWMLVRLAEKNQASRDLPRDATPMAVVKDAADVLKNWPRGFHALLRRVGDHTGKHRLSVVGINARFRGFYHSMFQVKPHRGELEFLRQEYTRFGLTEWGESIVDERAVNQSIEDERRYVSKAELARYLGVNPSTVSEWQKKGLLTLKEVTTNKTKRYIADTEMILVPLRTAGRTLTVREAAKSFGFPFKVLNALRKSGHYWVCNRPSRLHAYHENDLQQFKEMLLRPVLQMAVMPKPGDSLISLGRIMDTLKFGSPERKARFVEQYLDGTIKAVGRGGDNVADIYFERDLARKLASMARVEAAGETMTVLATSRVLQCYSGVVQYLRRDNYVSPDTRARSSRILKSSVDAFSEKYVQLTHTAVAQGTTSLRLARLAKRAGIVLLKVPYLRGTQRLTTYFLERNDEARLQHEVDARPARRRWFDAL